MSKPKVLSGYIYSIIVSVIIIALNFLAFLFFYTNNGLSPNGTLINVYARKHNDVSVCRLSNAPLSCLRRLMRPEDFYWGYDELTKGYNTPEALTVDCTSISNKDIQLLCDMEKRGSFTLEECKKLRGIGAFNECIEEVAVLTKDAKFCQLVRPTPQPDNFTAEDKQSWREAILESCVTKVGRITKDFSACSQLAHPWRKHECIREERYR